ncbi:MAG: twin-arginine translocase subunit TatB [Oligoflexia bacterium]|nr:twin-arginine translocase subunit TatB [Oligoflexia bacterium]
MFNLGFSEVLILAAIALIFIGPKELPQIAKVIGRMLGEFRRALSDVSQSMDQQVQTPPKLKEQGTQSNGDDTAKS